MQRSRRRQIMAAMAMVLPLLALAAIDLGLSAAAMVPPEDPLVFYARTFEAGFTPFVADDEAWTIRPDWRSDGQLRVRQGAQLSEVFILPGFRAARVPRHKPVGNLRIFVVGGSAVHGVGLAAEQTLPAQLQQKLAKALPGRHLNVYNLGCPGWASERVRALVGTLLTMEPDLIVVQSGHNELLRGALEPLASLGPLARLRLQALRHSALYRWLDHVVGPEAQPAAAQLLADGQRWLSGEAVSRAAQPGAAAERAAYLAAAPASYRHNLQAIHAAAAAVGVPVVFILPAANLRVPPKQPVHAAGFKQLAAFDEALAASQSAFRSGDMAASLAAMDRAITLSPGHAVAHFGRGLTLLAMERRSDALAALRQARDRDDWTHRITSTLEAAFSAAMAASAAPFLDAREITDPLAPQEISPFTDHCHLSAAGHEAMAEGLLSIVLRELAAAP